MSRIPSLLEELLEDLYKRPFNFWSFDPENDVQWEWVALATDLARQTGLIGPQKQQHRLEQRIKEGDKSIGPNQEAMLRKALGPELCEKFVGRQDEMRASRRDEMDGKPLIEIDDPEVYEELMEVHPEERESPFDRQKQEIGELFGEDACLEFKMLASELWLKILPDCAYLTLHTAKAVGFLGALSHSRVLPYGTKLSPCVPRLIELYIQ